MTPLTRNKVTLSSDFIRCRECLACVERLLADAADFAEIAVDFDTGRTTIWYPVAAFEPVSRLTA